MSDAAKPRRRGGVLRFIGMPIFRVAEQISESRDRIGFLREEARVAREKALAAFNKVDAQGMTSAQRFEALYEANHWSEEELAKQLSAIRLTKRAAIGSTLVGLVLAVITMWFLPMWALFLAAPGCAGLAALGLARAAQFGLYQAQIEERRILKLSQYAARADFFSHLLLK